MAVGSVLGRRRVVAIFAVEAGERVARLGEREKEMIEVIYRLWGGGKVGQRADGYPEVRVTPPSPSLSPPLFAGN